MPSSLKDKFKEILDRYSKWGLDVSSSFKNPIWATESELSNYRKLVPESNRSFIKQVVGRVFNNIIDPHGYSAYSGQVEGENKKTGHIDKELLPFILEFLSNSKYRKEFIKNIVFDYPDKDKSIALNRTSKETLDERSALVRAMFGLPFRDNKKVFTVNSPMSLSFNRDSILGKEKLREVLLEPYKYNSIMGTYGTSTSPHRVTYYDKWDFAPNSKETGTQSKGLILKLRKLLSSFVSPLEIKGDITRTEAKELLQDFILHPNIKDSDSTYTDWKSKTLDDIDITSGDLVDGIFDKSTDFSKNIQVKGRPGVDYLDYGNLGKVIDRLQYKTKQTMYSDDKVEEPIELAPSYFLGDIIKKKIAEKDKLQQIINSKIESNENSKLLEEARKLREGN